MKNEDWKIAFDLNFFAALYGIRAVLPIMKKQGGGQIVNIISGIAVVPMAMQTRYAATKAALNGLSLALRAEYWDDNIKVNSATPGTTATGIFQADGNQAPPDAQLPELAASSILNAAAENIRLSYGSEDDSKGGRYAFVPEAQPDYDDYLIEVTRERKKGKVAF